MLNWNCIHPLSLFKNGTAAAVAIAAANIYFFAHNKNMRSVLSHHHPSIDTWKCAKSGIFFEWFCSPPYFQCYEPVWHNEFGIWRMKWFDVNTIFGRRNMFGTGKGEKNAFIDWSPSFEVEWKVSFLIPAFQSHRITFECMSGSNKFLLKNWGVGKTLERPLEGGST